MKMFEKIKTKHHFIFKKTTFNTKNNAFYKTIADTFLIAKAKKIADECNCEVYSFIQQSNWFESRIIEIYATKKDYINFCTVFCDYMGNYIEDIEIK